jgi:hypothetical protein
VQVNIVTTLRKKLFDFPEPPHREAYFAAAAEEMFPGRATIIAFLEERHFDQQVELAKTILLRLAYRARVFPPNKLLFNLLEAESRLGGTAAKAPFNGRDHFVHLVNLYLLGLYVFWYHDSLHKRITLQFSDLIQSPERLSKPERQQLTDRAFVTAWRDFVLFHDLGYPWEAAAGLDNSPRFLAPFAEALRYAAKDAALFVVSQLLCLVWLREDEQPTLFEEDVSPFLPMSRTAQSEPFLFNPFPFPTAAEFEKTWSKAQRLPHTGDEALWLLVSEIIPETDRLAVLESIQEGHPVISPNSSLNQLLPTKRRLALEDEFDSEKMEIWAKRNLLPPKLKATHRWTYYVRDFDTHLRSFLSRLFPSPGDADRFRVFCHEFLSQSPLSSVATVPLHFEDSAFVFFHNLLFYLDFDLLDESARSSLAIQHQLVKGEQSGLQSTLLAEVSRGLKTMLQKRADQLNEREPPVNPTSVSLPEYLSELLSTLPDHTKIALEVEKKLSKHVKSRVALKRDLFGFYSKLKEQITAAVDKLTLPLFPSVDPHQPNGMIGNIDWDIFEKSGVAGGVSLLLKEHGLGDLHTLKGYRPSFAPKEGDTTSTYCDHGIASGLLLSQMQNAWPAVLEETPDALKQMLRLRGYLESTWQQRDVAKAIGHEVVYTVFVHNVYPKALPEVFRSFRTKLGRRDAFTFVALLCDSLQPWDRKRLFNPATGSLPYTTFAENFNLEITDGTLRVTERGDQLRIDEREMALRRFLDQFLEGGSQFVKLFLAEWR